jgi:hypothetical protein
VIETTKAVVRRSLKKSGDALMNSASAVNPAHRSRIVIAAKSIVVLQSLAIVYLLTSAWMTVAVAAGFVVVFVAVKALSRASGQVDRIFDEELSRQ